MKVSHVNMSLHQKRQKCMQYSSAVPCSVVCCLSALECHSKKLHHNTLIYIKYVIEFCGDACITTKQKCDLALKGLQYFRKTYLFSTILNVSCGTALCDIKQIK